MTELAVRSSGTPSRATSPQVQGGAAPAVAHRVATPWATAGAVALGLALVDGFLVVSLRGSVGAVERVDSPFATWLQESLLATPVYLVAVLAALAIARRRVGPQLHSAKKVVAAALLVAAAGTVVGVAGAAVSAAYDYKLQSTLIQTSHSLHTTPAIAKYEAQGPACGPVCQAEQTDLEVLSHALGYVSLLMLSANVVVVGWFVALRGGSLDGRTRRRATPAGQ